MPESALFMSSSVRLGRRGTDVFVAMALRDQARVLEDGPQPLRLEKPAGERGDQRRVEGREASELDADLVAQWTPLARTIVTSGPMARRAALALLALWIGATVLGGCTAGGLQGPTLATTTPAGAPGLTCRGTSGAAPAPDPPRRSAGVHPDPDPEAGWRRAVSGRRHHA